MTDNERNTKFAIFAESHYLELSDLFAEMYACQITNDHSGEDEAKHSIQTLLAQRAYDLTCHGIDYLSVHGWYTPTQKQELLDAIPDLDAWPTTER